MSKLVEEIRKHLLQMAPHQQERKTAKLLKEAADLIEQQDEKLDRLAENLNEGF